MPRKAAKLEPVLVAKQIFNYCHCSVCDKQNVRLDQTTGRWVENTQVYEIFYRKVKMSKPLCKRCFNRFVGQIKANF